MHFLVILSIIYIMYFFLQPANKILKYTFPLLGTLVLFFLIFQFDNGTAYALCRDDSGTCPCDANPAGTDDDEFCCQGDEMCCTGGGCPSWACENKKIDTKWYGFGYNKVKKTCCTKISGPLGNVEVCDDALAYREHGTCAWCPGTKDKIDPEYCVCPAGRLEVPKAYASLKY
ncbi:MAG: hypothetical protein U9R58_02340 [Chloroflexota bacterium]|nr:hypothetical protein [Chloroflexota bacterium]